MKSITKQDLARRITHWLFIAVTVLFLISGFGITEFRIVEPLTFGLLIKSLAFKIHYVLSIPFLVLLALHIFWALIKARK